jgi:hypothetical protein
MKTKTNITYLYLAYALLGFAYFALLPTHKAFGVLPPPDGGYPGANTAEGKDALFNLTTGQFNTANGFEALFKNTTGFWNTANGAGALHENVGGAFNTATGVNALRENQTGSHNTATGTAALRKNITGFWNTANGSGALHENTDGTYNTATGVNALFNNTSGSQNSACGAGALQTNTDGRADVANGVAALLNNITGSFNTANGHLALLKNTDGSSNVATGALALKNNTTGDNNTADGTSALDNNTTGRDNTALGGGAGGGVTTANNVICIGARGANVSNSCFVGHIRGVTTQNADAIAVLIDSAGQLGTVSSSARFKKEIKPMDKASETILALNPVVFHYKSDKTNTPQFGLIAEEVAAINPDLVIRDENGEIYTVRYEAVNAMLLNEFLKEHRTVQEMKKEIAVLTATVKEQALQIQKVSAQIELNKPAPRTALNNQ